MEKINKGEILQGINYFYTQEEKSNIMGKKKICCNCTFAGKQFKIKELTHFHCEHPKYDEMDEKGDLSPWETLCEFGSTCDLYKPK